MEPHDRIAATLAAHDVNFVVIGNYGAQLHGVPVETEENHRRLLAALGEMDAHMLRADDFTIPLPTDNPGLLEERNFWRLRTIHGDVDLIFSPLGGGYDHLLSKAEWVSVSGYLVLVASLDDIIRSKELANRDKDHRALPELRRFRDEQRRQREGPGLSFDL